MRKYEKEWDEYYDEIPDEDFDESIFEDPGKITEDFQDIADKREELREEDLKEEIPETYEEVPEEVPEEMLAEDKIIDHEVDWEEDIEKLKDPKIRDREIKAVEEIHELEEDLKARLESGEIHERDYIKENEEIVMKQKRMALTRTFLENKGVASKDYPDIFEDWDHPDSSPMMKGTREGWIGKMVKEIGSEDVEELNDRMLHEGKISRESHEAVSEQIKLHSK